MQSEYAKPPPPPHDAQVGEFTYLSLNISILLLGEKLETLREQITQENVPTPFRGTPITLISAGIMSLAFMGFQGIAS